jgi:hypothetical protein
MRPLAGMWDFPPDEFQARFRQSWLLGLGCNSLIARWAYIDWNATRAQWSPQAEPCAFLNSVNLISGLLTD